MKTSRLDKTTAKLTAYNTFAALVASIKANRWTPTLKGTDEDVRMLRGALAQQGIEVWTD